MQLAPRPTLIVIGSLLALGAVVVGLAFNPSLQRWAVLRAARSQPGLQLDVAAVSAGLHGLTVRGVKATHSGVAIEIGQLEADYSLWSILVHRRLQIRRLVASGVLVDASRIARGSVEVQTAAGSVATPGVLARVQLPVELFLGECDIQGRAFLPGAPGMAPIRADYKISGGRIAPGKEGVLLLDGRLTDSSPAARVSALRLRLSLHVTETLARSFSHVGVTAVVEAEGPQLTGATQLKLMAQVEHTAARESYTVNVDTLMHGVAAHLLDVRAELAAGQKNYTGSWNLKATHVQLAPFFLGGALPEFAASGTGRFSLQPANDAATLQGSLEVTAGELGAIRPALRALGEVTVRTEFDVVREGAIVRLNALKLAVAGAAPVVTAQATRSVEVNLAERRLVVGAAAKGEILRVKLLGLPLAWVRPFVSEVDISGGQITGELALTGDGTRMSAQTVAPLTIDGLTVVQEGRLLLNKAVVTLRAEAELLSTELNARVLDFAMTTPQGDKVTAQGEIRLPAGPAQAISVNGRYEADLPALATAFIPFGHIRAKGEIDASMHSGKITVRRASADISSGRGEKILSGTALREFALDFSTGAVVTGPGARDIVRVSIGALALGPLLPERAGVEVGGNFAPGEFVVASEGDKISVRTVAPLKFSEIVVARNKQRLADRISIELSPTVEIAGRTGIRVQSGEVILRAADGRTLLTSKGEASTSPTDGMKLSANFQLELPVLATQPLFAATQAVTQGRASGELRGALNGRAAQIEARVTLNNLVAREGNRALPVANVSLRAVAQTDGKISLQVPVLIDRVGQRSDLNLSAELVPAGDVMQVAAKLSGEKIELEDAMGLLAVFFGSAAPAGPAPAPTGKNGVGPDSSPVWALVNGNLDLDVKSVVRGKDWAMTGLTGRVAIEPTVITLQKLEAAFGEKGRLRAKAAMKFTSGGSRPYQLEGDFALTEFDVGKLFRAFDPSRPATLEGVFAVAGRFQGNGATIPTLADRTHGQFDLTSRQGVFRGLKRSADKVSTTTKAVELGASVLGSLFGQEKIAKAAEKLAGQAYFIDQLATSLGELPYDQFSVRLTRDEALNILLENVSLVSPEIRLLGRGQITFVDGKPLLELPLSAELSLSGRGKIEQNLGKIGVLDGSRDELGYAKLKMPVSVGGTLGRPDPTPFFVRLAKGKLTDFLTPDS